MKPSRPSFPIPTRRIAAVACVAAVALSGIVGCVPTVSGRGAGTVATAEVGRVQGPYAPSGQRFVVRLDQTIDSLHSAVGSGFRAHLVAPLVGADGSMIAPAGAAVRGRVFSVGTVVSPIMRLEFDSIDTAQGPAALPARIREAEYRRYDGPLVNSPARLARGGGPGSPFWSGYSDIQTIRTRPIQLPAGAQMGLELTRPLVPPGSAIAPR